MSGQAPERGDVESRERSGGGSRRSFLKTCAGVVGAFSIGDLGTDVASAHHLPVYNYAETVQIPADNFNFVSPDSFQRGSNWGRGVMSVPDVNGIAVGTTAYSGGAGYVRAEGWAGLQFTAGGNPYFEAAFAGYGFVPKGYSTVNGYGTGTASNIVDFVVYDSTANQEVARQRLFNQFQGSLEGMVELRPEMRGGLRAGRHYAVYFDIQSTADTTNTGTRSAFLLPTLNQISIFSG